MPTTTKDRGLRADTMQTLEQTENHTKPLLNRLEHELLNKNLENCALVDNKKPGTSTHRTLKMEYENVT